jgi:histidinol-phosphate phosphatase family protein
MKDFPFPALVLAGGLGTRLADEVPELPKSMAPVGGRPFAEWLVEALALQGVRRIVFCTGHRHETIEEHFGDGSRFGVHVSYSREDPDSPLGTAGAARLAVSRDDSDTQRFLVVNGDSLTRFDLPLLARRHEEQRARGTLWTVPVEDASRFGSVLADEDGRVLGFEEKLAPRGNRRVLVNAGVALFERVTLVEIPGERAVSLEREVLPALAARGVLWTVSGEGPLLDIGTPESYRGAAEVVASLRGDATTFTPDPAPAAEPAPESTAPAIEEAAESAAERPAEPAPEPEPAPPAPAVEAVSEPEPEPAPEPEPEPAPSRRFVLLDRDGTVIVDRGHLSDPEGVELIPGAGEALARLAERGLGLVLVTNQSAVGRGIVDLEKLDEIHAALAEHLAPHGVAFAGTFFCPHLPDEGCDCRKPGTALALRAARELGFDPARAFVVGDKTSDIEMGRAVGAATVLVRTGYGREAEASGDARADHVADDLTQAAAWIEANLEGRTMPEEDRSSPARPTKRDEDQSSSARPAMHEEDRSSPAPPTAPEEDRSSSARRRAEESLAATSILCERLAQESAEAIAEGASRIVAAFRDGKKLLLCGNGGSAADCQHMATEFVSRLSRERDRRALPAIALTTDTSLLTAFANDSGFEGVFARQVEALGAPGDVLVAISTSGNSKNVILAVAAAKKLGLTTLGLLGEGGALTELVDWAIVVPSRDTQRIQEALLPIEHVLCEIVEEELFGPVSR